MYYKTSNILSSNNSITTFRDGYTINFIDPSPGNLDYEKYKQWLDAGNEPEPLTSEVIEQYFQLYNNSNQS